MIGRPRQGGCATSADSGTWTEIHAVRAVFLDRDGTINEDEPGRYILAFDDFILIDGVPEVIARLCKAGFEVLVITNQSAVGRGWLDVNVLQRMNEHLVERVKAAGGTISHIYFCPHRPEDECACRKPETGMIDRALSEHPEIVLGESFLVGDSCADMELARKMGLRSILVLTGYGSSHQSQLSESNIVPETVAADLPRAVDYILDNG